MSHFFCCCCCLSILICSIGKYRKCCCWRQTNCFTFISNKFFSWQTVQQICTYCLLSQVSGDYFNLIAFAFFGITSEKEQKKRGGRGRKTINSKFHGFDKFSSSTFSFFFFFFCWFSSLFFFSFFFLKKYIFEES